MATILQNAQRIKAASDDIREVIDLCYDEVAEDERIEDYAPKLARLAVDEPTEQVIAAAARTTAGGVAIKDSIAVVDKVYGNTIVWNQLAECKTSSAPIKYNRISYTYGVYEILELFTSWYAIVDFTPIVGHNYLGFSKKLNDLYNEEDSCTIYYGTKKSKMDSASFFEVNDETIKNTMYFGATNTPTYQVGFKFLLFIFDLTRMFGSGQEPTTLDDFCLKIFGKASSDVTDAEWEAVSAYSEPTLLSSKPKKIVSKAADDSWEVETDIDPTTILDADGNKLFPNGLLSAGTAKDEIDYTNGKAVKRVEADYTAMTTSALVTPIEVTIPKRKQFYRVSNGGTERITADGMTTPMVADIGYREAVTASEAVAMLAEAAGV